MSDRPATRRSTVESSAPVGHRSRASSFVGRAIGNVVAHEIGHYVGAWHTDNTNTMINLMDAGGGPFGVGPDGVGGSADDADTDLAMDVFRPLEEFTGIEDTINRTAFGLSGFRTRG
jgi:hypothetical protein